MGRRISQAAKLPESPPTRPFVVELTRANGGIPPIAQPVRPFATQADPADCVNVDGTTAFHVHGPRTVPANTDFFLTFEQGLRVSGPVRPQITFGRIRNPNPAGRWRSLRVIPTRWWFVVLSLTFELASLAHAAPGDPRLVQGVLEWPTKLTAEPFVVIRTDDGRWYYADIKSARRLEPAGLTVGARVAVLGTEAARPHEITALAFGSGNAAALALALMPHTNPPAPSSASGPATTAELLGPVKPSAAAPPKSAAKVEPAAVAAAPATTVQPEPGPPANLRVGEPRKQLTPVKTMTPSELKPSTSASTRLTGTSRWSELRGTVHAVAGHEVVVRVDDGQLMSVDLSGLGGVAVELKPGSPIVVYGTRGEEEFQAMGLIQQETRPPAKPVAAPQRR